MWHLNETWNSNWNEMLNDKAEIVCALWNKWNHKIWNDIQNQNQVRHFKMNTSTSKKNKKKKNLKKNFSIKFFEKNFWTKFQKIQKNFKKKFFQKIFFFFLNQKKNFKKIFCKKKKILQNFFFKNRICQTEFSNATKHLQKSNRHKESFFPTLACVIWPDLSPEL